MTVNVGTIDRVLRVVIGVALLALAVIGAPSPFDGLVATYGMGVLGVVMLLVAVTRFCPLYALVGLSTSGKAA